MLLGRAVVHWEAIGVTLRRPLAAWSFYHDSTKPTALACVTRPRFRPSAAPPVFFLFCLLLLDQHVESSHESGSGHVAQFAIGRSARFLAVIVVKEPIMITPKARNVVTPLGPRAKVFDIAYQTVTEYDGLMVRAEKRQIYGFLWQDPGGKLDFVLRRHWSLSIPHSYVTSPLDVHQKVLWRSFVEYDMGSHLRTRCFFVTISACPKQVFILGGVYLLFSKKITE
jgi:hypothetical protein